MRILEGVGTLVQLGGLMARLCKVVRDLITWLLFATPAELHFISAGDEARTVPNLKKHLSNAFVFSSPASFALLRNAIVSPIPPLFDFAAGLVDVAKDMAIQISTYIFRGRVLVEKPGDRRDPSVSGN